MHEPNSEITEQNATVFGRIGASGLIDIYPDLFEKLPIRVSKLAKMLGIKVVLSDTISAKGRLSCSRKKDSSRNYTIYINRNQNPNISRFTLAHEIGHLYLEEELRNGSREFIELTQLKQKQIHEQYSHAFAQKLLIPNLHEQFIIEKLDAIRNPGGYMRLANHAGFSLHAFCRAIQDNYWLKGNRAWIMLAYMPHPKQKDSSPEQRIQWAAFDRNKFFIPLYRRATSFINPTTWLYGDKQGREIRRTDVSFEISKKINQPNKKYKKSSVLTAMCATRLSPYKSKVGSQFLIAVQINESF